MKRIKLILLILIITGTFFGAYSFYVSKTILTKTLSDIQNNTSPLVHSQIVKTQVDFSGGHKRDLLVYLPTGYDAKNTQQRYPVLYLLYGSPGDEKDWLNHADAEVKFNSLIEQKKITPFIVAMPDGNGNLFSDSQYLNSTDKKQLNEDFIYKNLVSFIDGNFNTLVNAKYRAIGGLSSGAFGALNIGLKHQDVFSEILSFSGYGIIDQNKLSQFLIQHSQETVKNNSPELYINHLKSKSVHVWQIIGQSDTLLNDAKKVHQELVKAGFDTVFTVKPGGHDWTFWSTSLNSGLLWLSGQWSTTSK